MRAVLPFLIVLACPLMMVVMMRGGHGHGAARGSAGHGGHDVPRTREERIADLEREIAALREEPDAEAASWPAGRR